MTLPDWLLLVSALLAGAVPLSLVAITTWETEEQARTFRVQLGADLMKQIQDVGELDESQIFETIAQA